MKLSVQDGCFSYRAGQPLLEHISFEVESGDRMEFELRGNEYGLLAEGDLGKLTFQGTRYLSFERG